MFGRDVTVTVAMVAESGFMAGNNEGRVIAEVTDFSGLMCHVKEMKGDDVRWET